MLKIIFLQTFLHDVTLIVTIYIYIINHSSKKLYHINLKITSISIPYKLTLI